MWLWQYMVFSENWPTSNPDRTQELYLHRKWGILRGSIYRLGKFSVMDCYSGVVSVDVSNSGPPQVEVIPLSTPTETLKAYIVEASSGGDLLLVQRFLEEKDHPQQLVTSCFKIFKLLGLGGGGGQKFTERVDFDSLDGDTLLLGDSYSLAVSVSNSQGAGPIAPTTLMIMTMTICPITPITHVRTTRHGHSYASSNLDSANAAVTTLLEGAILVNSTKYSYCSLLL